jgi:hypothetical protein
VAPARVLGSRYPRGSAGAFTPPSWTNLRGEEKHVYEPITVEVDRACGEGDYRTYTINFIGRLIRITSPAQKKV